MSQLVKPEVNLWILVLLLSSLTASCHAQGKPLKLLVKKDKDHYMTGYMYELKDSSIVMFKELTGVLRKEDLIEIEYYDLYTIEDLNDHRNNGMQVGVLGMCLGGLIGYAQGNDPPRVNNRFINFGSRATTAGEKAIGGSLIGLVSGIIIGKLLSKSVKHTIIDNKYRRFERQKNHLKKYQMVK